MDFIVDFALFVKKINNWSWWRISFFTEEQIQLDKERTTVLNELGYKVIRFTNNEVLTNIHSVLNKIQQELNQQEQLQNSNFVFPLREGWEGTYVQYFLDIVLERDVRIRQEFRFLWNYWDKMPRNLHSVTRGEECRSDYDYSQIERIGISSRDYPFCWRRLQPQSQG